MADTCDVLNYFSHAAFSDVVKYVKSAKNDINKRDEKGRTFLILACLSGKVYIVKLVCERGESDPNFDINAANAEGCTALMCAANDGHLEICEYLVMKGANVGQKSNCGSTALIHACFNGHIQIVSLLLQHGGSLEDESSHGWPPLMFACDQMFPDVVALLLQSGANVNATSKKGWTALMCAAHRGHSGIVNQLINAGAVVSVRNTDGCTPLMWAASTGHTAVCVMLLKAGANILDKDAGGVTAIQVAQKKGHKQVEKVLKRYAAQVEQPQENYEENGVDEQEMISQLTARAEVQAKLNNPDIETSMIQPLRANPIPGWFASVCGRHC